MNRTGGRVFLPVLLALAVRTSLHAQCVAELDVGEAAGSPGGQVVVTVIGEASCEVTGFSLAIGHDAAVLTFVDASPGEFLIDHAGSDLSFQVNSQPTFTVVGALFDISFPLTIPPTSIAAGTILASLEYEIEPGASPGVSGLLNRTRTYGGEILVSNIFSRPPGQAPIEPALADGSVTVEAPGVFRRADANSDGWIDVSDVVTILLQLFDGRPANCEKSADVDDSGTVSITDAVFLVDFVFGGGPPPADPIVGCGVDPTNDGLTCGSFTACEQ